MIDKCGELESDVVRVSREKFCIIYIFCKQTKRARDSEACVFLWECAYGSERAEWLHTVTFERG